MDERNPVRLRLKQLWWRLERLFGARLGTAVTPKTRNTMIKNSNNAANLKI